MMDESALLGEDNLSPQEIADYSTFDESLLLGIICPANIHRD